jgi:hypothetical protein
MTSTQLQGRTLAKCIAYSAVGKICGRPASILDEQRGGMVCHVHAPRPQYETTRSVLAKAEELLCDAVKHAQKERPGGSPDQGLEILRLAMRARTLRCLLEKGAGQ